MEHITYGPGGFDPGSPDGNVIERREVDLPEQASTAAEERIAALEAEVRAIKGAAAAEAAKSTTSANAVANAVANAKP